MNAMKLAIKITGRNALASLFGVSPQAVTQWAQAQVPADRCPAIERATLGHVRCEDLRPDIDWSVLRNSDCPQANGDAA